MPRRKPKANDGWIAEYRPLLRPTFVDVKGRVFVAASRSKQAVQDVVDRFRERDPDATHENTDNHEHFWFFDNDTIEGFRSNYVLAETVRLAWHELLSQQFPERDFRLFVSNEYIVTTKDDSTDVDAQVDYQEVVPTLRLWTTGDSTEQGFEELYALAARGPESAWWYNSQEFGVKELSLEVSKVFEVIIAGQQTPLTVKQLVDRLREV